MAPLKMEKKILEVVDGPPEFDLVLTLFRRERVEFTTTNIGRVKAAVTSVARGNVSTGYLLQGRLFWEDPWGIPQYSHSFSGSYDTRSRKGSFTANAVVREGGNSLMLLSCHLDLRGHQRLAEALDLPRKGGIPFVPNQSN